MNIVITGGCGFIGSHLADSYSENNNIVLLDNKSTGNNAVTTNSKLIHLDLCDRKAVDSIEHVFESADLVYHLASPVGVRYIDNNPERTLRCSFDINNNLFPIFEKYKNRVIFASTSEVYGETKSAKETDTLKIGSPDKLRWGYACSKLMSEFLLMSYDFPSTITRFFNIVGPRQVADHGMVLPSFIKAALAHEDIIVYGQGTQYRSFCDIRDAIQMLKIVSEPDHINQIYNIGSPKNTITITDLANMVIELTSSNSRIIYKDSSHCFSKHFADIHKRKPNIDKIGQYYQPTFNLTDIIQNILKN